MDRCKVIEKFLRGDKIAPASWRHVSRYCWEDVADKLPTHLNDKCDWQSLSGRALMDLLAVFPSLSIAKYCNWSKLTGSDWRDLLKTHPEFAGYCNWKKLSGEDWKILLHNQPQFVDKCDWGKLDSRQYQMLVLDHPDWRKYGTQIDKTRVVSSKKLPARAKEVFFEGRDFCDKAELIDALEIIEKNQYDQITLRFCQNIGRFLNLTSQTVLIRDLFIFESSNEDDFPLSREIGRLKQLQRLRLQGHGGGLWLDAAMTKSLAKLKNLEKLQTLNFDMSVNALPEFGALKSLKELTLYLDQRIKKADFMRNKSFLRGLKKLEYLELSLPRASWWQELELPPNLKSLVVNHKMCKLPER